MEEDLDRLSVYVQGSVSMNERPRVELDPAAAAACDSRRCSRGGSRRHDSPAVMTMNSQMPRFRVCNVESRVSCACSGLPRASGMGGQVAPWSPRWHPS